MDIEAGEGKSRWWNIEPRKFRSDGSGMLELSLDAVGMGFSYCGNQEELKLSALEHGRPSIGCEIGCASSWPSSLAR